MGVVVPAGSAEPERAAAINPDWITVACGPTLMRHPPNLLASLAEIQQRQIPVIISGVFEGGFLVGANRLDGRLLRSEDDPDRSTLAWRKAFVALCDGHGISPAHACIRFALRCRVWLLCESNLRMQTGWRRTFGRRLPRCRQTFGPRCRKKVCWRQAFLAWSNLTCDDRWSSLRRCIAPSKFYVRA